MCLALIVLTVLLLGACGHTPVTRTVWEAMGTGKSVDAIKLNPKLRYLRVTVRGRVALMVLGYVDASPDGPLETWYSSEGEVIRLQNGRVVATAGLETNWREVRPVALPPWKDMLGSASTTYQRERDEMPGFRFGISESVSLYAVRTPTNARLVGVPVQDLRWYEEAVLGQPGGLPSARYALRIEDNEPRVVYAEQCLSPVFCLAWQIWPAR
jgi:Group 4 capsule polysaccharide lipoprotein gfcB, YjbF